MNLVRFSAILSMLAISAFGKPPTGTHAIGELPEVQAEALKRGKAVAFPVSDPNSKYRKVQDATAMAIKELRSYSVVVFRIWVGH